MRYLFGETLVDRVRSPARKFPSVPAPGCGPSRTATWVATGRAGFMVRIFRAR